MAEGVERQECSNGTDGVNGNTGNNNISNNNTNALRQGQQDRLVQTPQDAHTREKLFDFIALLQGRRMDDQRATLKP